MRAWIIKSAAEKIEERERALKWLEEYGVNIIGRGDSDQLSVSVHMNYAGACAGADDAAKLIASYAKVSAPDLVNSAIQCCRNDIALYKDQIAAELSAPEVSNDPS